MQIHSVWIHTIGRKYCKFAMDSAFFFTDCYAFQQNLTAKDKPQNFYC